MKIPSRIICLLLSAALMLGLAACGTEDKREEAEPQDLSGENTVDMPYMASVISKPPGMRRIKAMCIEGDKLYVLGTFRDEECIFASEPGEGKWQEIKIELKAPEKEEEESSESFPSVPPEICAFSVDGDSIYVAAAFLAEIGLEYYIYEFDLSGRLINSLKPEGLEKQYVNYWISAGEYFIACLEDSSPVFSAHQAGALYSLDKPVIFAAVSEDELYAAFSGDSENELCRFNIETGELQKVCGFPSQEYMSYSSYVSEKGLYIADEKSLYSADPDSGEIKELLKWNDTGAGIVSAPECLHIMENGEMYMADTWSNIMYRVVPYDGKPKKVLTIAYTIAGGVYESAARAKFNMENEDYIIREMRFDMEHPETLITQITAGEVPDILYMGSSTSREMDNPFLRVDVDDSLCVDLMPYLDKEPELKAGFVPGLLDKLCPSGELYKMPADFNIWSVVVPKELAEQYDEWNFDVLMDINENLPEDCVLFSGNREDFLRYFCHYCSLRFVNAAEGSCSFDDPDFARWLEYIKDMEYPDGDKNGLIDFTLVHAGLPRFCRERFGDYVYLGVPDSEGGMSFFTENMGGYSIMAGSENKDAAWEYIKIMLSYEIQDAFSVFGMQVMDRNLQERLDRASEYTEFTEEDRAKLNELIENAEGFAFGGMLEKIIIEEAQKYFAGQKSLEETVKLINSRAGLYLAERK